MELDRFDVSLLDMLQRDCRAPAEVLGERVGLSATAVQRRIRRLRSEGAISADVAVVEPAVLPSVLVVIVEVALKQGLGAAVDSFRRDVASRAEVQQCYYVAGDHDFVLVVVTRGMDDYERFTREVFFTNDNIARFRSTMVMESVKRGLQLPLLPARG